MEHSWKINITLGYIIVILITGIFLFIEKNLLFDINKYSSDHPLETKGYDTDEEFIITQNNVFRYEKDFVDMEDKGLVQFIRQRWLVRPLPNYKPPIVTADKEHHYSQVGQSKFVDKLLKQRRNGFFIESGAANGIDLSNSLFFENHRGWSGLLVEPKTKPFRNIIYKRPGSYAINACLSTTKQAGRASFEQQPLFRHDKDSMHEGKGNKTIVQCFPIFSILSAIGKYKIDYFSLDIDGAEVDVLKTIPWDKIRIDVLTVEYRASPESKKDTLRRLKLIRDFFQTFEIYEEVTVLKLPDGGGLDVVFARKDILE
jgi:hypothetical protein